MGLLVVKATLRVKRAPSGQTWGERSRGAPLTANRRLRKEPSIKGPSESLSILPTSNGGSPEGSRKVKRRKKSKETTH